MRLLITNDDGYAAPGIRALMAALRPEHEMVVVAPESEQSAVGHAITLSDPIKVRQVSVEERLTVWSVKGTPADCVKLAFWHLLADQPPELVVSGINRGANVGLNVLYSGTVSAATEAGLLGLPAMAVSLDSFDPWADYGPAARLAAELVAGLAGQGALSPGRVLNINVPNRPDLSRALCRLTRQGLEAPAERFLGREDPRGNLYYWSDVERHLTPFAPDTDQAALSQGLVSVTPIHFDLTDHASLDILRNGLRF